MKVPPEIPADATLEDAVAEQETVRETVRSGARARQPSNRRTIGRYQILERLGKGGMGVVWAAHDPHLKRKVAVKLLRPDIEDAVHEERLLTEARAMARLSHPNVVHVYDAAADDGQLFVAMELVDGTNVARWLREGRRTWPEVLGVFLAAGRGLAAAHAADIVHRDFKPSNVLLSRDGRVLVTDFGLARATALEPDADRVRADIAAAGALGPTFHTVTGTLIGTPAFMAPEQFPGGTADARSDQFAFCVALYHSLYEVHPFGAAAATGAPSLLGELPSRPPDTDVPRPIFAILTRGMARDPDARYPDLHSLLDDLGGAMPAARRRVTLAGAAAAGAVALGVVLFGMRSDEPDPCRSADQPAAALWNPAARGQVEAAFRKAGAPDGAAAFARVDRALSERVARIRAMRRDACLASEVRHEESPALFDRRIQCLDRRAEEIASFTSVFAGAPERAVMDRAVEAAVSLAPVAACADREALLASVPPPDDPVVRARVAELDQTLARVDRLGEAGKFQEAASLAERALAEAEGLDYRPIRARAHLALGKARVLLSDGERAAAEVRVAIELAAAARDDALLADAWILLYDAVGHRLSRPDDARSFEPAVVAAVERTGNQRQRGALENVRGAIAMNRGDYAVAADHFGRAHAHLVAALGPDSIQVSDVLDNAGRALSSVARNDEARAALEESMAIRVALLGPDHPRVGHSERSIGMLLDTLGKPAEALPHFERSAAIYQKSLPPDHPQLANALSSLGVALDNLDRSDEALPRHLVAIAILEKKPKDHPIPLSYALGNLGVSYMNMERNQEAIRSHERALAAGREALGPDHPFLASTLCAMGTAARLTGDRTRARDLCRRALAMLERKLGRDHPECSGPLKSLAEIALDSGRPAEALELMARARGLEEKAGETEVSWYGETLFLHGRALVGVERTPEGLALMERGLELMKSHGSKKKDVAQARTRLAAAKRR